MILELVGLTPAHAHHDRSRYDVSLARSSAQLSQSPEQSVPPMHAVISELTQLNCM